ncbi:MAG: helix-turn-helix transcriptional regulator [Lachnospiraceae bacterium]|nr:helix-turn-helix transcriptional regulator [Lachnospiraceae bacterium]
MSEILQIVSGRLKEYRLQKGYTQETLAEKAGLHNTYIGQVERGEKNITLGSLEKILKALDISFSELFDGFDEPRADASLNYPQLCYDLLNSKSEEDQKHLYEILETINKMTSHKPELTANH